MSKSYSIKQIHLDKLSVLKEEYRAKLSKQQRRVLDEEKLAWQEWRAWKDTPHKLHIEEPVQKTQIDLFDALDEMDDEICAEIVREYEEAQKAQQMRTKRG